MTSHFDSHRPTDIKPEMLSGVQTGNGTPHAKYDICSIAHARTNRKDDIFMQRRIVQNFTFILEWSFMAQDLKFESFGNLSLRHTFSILLLQVWNDFKQSNIKLQVAPPLVL